MADLESLHNALTSALRGFGTTTTVSDIQHAADAFNREIAAENKRLREEIAALREVADDGLTAAYLAGRMDERRSQ